MVVVEFISITLINQAHTLFGTKDTHYHDLILCL